MTELFTDLETLRLTRDWSYQQLADEIATTTNRRRNQDCWRKLCQGVTKHPQKRTVDIAEVFLAAVKTPTRRRRSA
jgi:hypothetical protein